MREAPELNRLRRGLVLATLAANYPHQVADGLLYRQVKSYYPSDAPQFGRDVAYLAERGYLDATEDRVRGSVVKSYRITAAGIDLVERTSNDPGVEFEDL